MERRRDGEERWKGDERRLGGRREEDAGLARERVVKLERNEEEEDERNCCQVALGQASELVWPWQSWPRPFPCVGAKACSSQTGSFYGASTKLLRSTAVLLQSYKQFKFNC